MCKHVMKFSADKVGKRAKCPKCDAVVLVQAEEEAKKPEPAPVAEAEGGAPAAPQAKPMDDDEFGATGNYDVYTDPEIEERRKALQAEEEAKKKKDRKKLPKVTRKVKAIPDAPAWSMVRLGMLFVNLGIWIWLGCHVLQGSYVLLGSVEFPEFANMMAGELQLRLDEGIPEKGHNWDLDWLRVYLGMIAGRDFLNLAITFLTISSVFYFFQALLWIGGYACLLPVPRRYGMFGHVLILLGLGVFNMLMMFLFKFLPVIGAHNYIMIPFVVPEIVLTEYNQERMVPINVLWTNWPFWENVLNLIFKFAFYLEPTFISIFVWSAGIAIKDDNIEKTGKGRTLMSLGTFFILVCFHLLSLCGASPVLVNVLRVIYGVWYFFLIIFMLQYAMMLLKFRAVLYDKINPKHELEDEEPRKKKKK